MIRVRSPRQTGTSPAVSFDPDRVASYLQDAAHVPGGAADAVAFPENESDVAVLLASHAHVLAVGAQSSLTGGATPTGGLVLSTARMAGVTVAGDRVTVGPGVTLAALDAVLAPAGAWYPPAPTYLGATVGGVIATNAAGPATFKYGTTRDWVEALTVVLPTGEVLDLARGDVRAHADGYVELHFDARRVRIDLPSYRRPAVPKVSSGYFAAPRMDLIDLFIGAEGTLGVVTDATLRIVGRRPAWAMALVTCPSADVGYRLVARLRDAARVTWRTRDVDGVDVAAVEMMDRRSLALLREDGADRIHDVALPDDSALALLVTMEVPATLDAARAFDEIGRALEPRTPATPLVRFCRLLEEEGLLERTELALPGDRRQAALVAIREAVPASVNQRIARGQQTIDSAIEKIAADVIVPFEQVPALCAAFEEGFEARRLDGAVWGHISDGNLHANVIPRSRAELDAGKAAVLSFGRIAMGLGGAPCAEHGVGRNPIKQQLMRELVGDAGLDAMRRVKRALDPAGVLAPGVLGLGG